MESKFYKIGNIILNMQTPEALSSDAPYCFFETSEGTPSAVFSFKYGNVYVPENAVPFFENEFFFAVKKDGKSYFYYKLMDNSGCYAVRVNKIGSAPLFPLYSEITVSPDYKGRLWTRVAFNLCGIEDVFNRLNAVILHSSFVEYEKQAVLFTAGCGVGKSTQAALWQNCFNSDIINGDKAMLYFENDVLFAAGLPFAGTSGICKNSVYPVKAIVRLSQAKQNTINRLQGFNAFSAVYKGIYQSAENSANIITSAEKITAAASVYHLACLPDDDAARLSKNTIFGGI